MDKSSPSAPTSSVLDHLCINTIRFLSIDAIQKANSGHPGMPMGEASMATSSSWIALALQLPEAS